MTACARVANHVLHDTFQHTKFEDCRQNFEGRSRLSLLLERSSCRKCLSWWAAALESSEPLLPPCPFVYCWKSDMYFL